MIPVSPTTTGDVMDADMVNEQTEVAVSVSGVEQLDTVEQTLPEMNNEVNELASVVIDDELQPASEQGVPLNFDVPPIIETHHPSPPPSTSIVFSSPSSSSTQSLLSPGGFQLALHPEPSSVLSTPRKDEATHGVSSTHTSKRNKKHSKRDKENKSSKTKKHSKKDKEKKGNYQREITKSTNTSLQPRVLLTPLTPHDLNNNIKKRKLAEENPIPKRTCIAQDDFPAEEDLTPDYAEDSRYGNGVATNQLAELASSVVQQVQEHPRIIASSINSLSQQFATTNHGFSKLADKFSDFLSAYKEGEKSRASGNRLLGNIMTELTTLSKTARSQLNATDKLREDVQRLDKTMVDLGDRLHVTLVGAASTAAEKPQTSTDSDVAHVQPPIVDHDMSNFECDLAWQRQQEDNTKHFNARRHEYPYNHSPNDNRRVVDKSWKRGYGHDTRRRH